MSFNIDEYLYRSPNGGGNWFVYKDYYKKIAHNPNILTAVEVGVWKGHAISFLAQEMLKANKRNFKLYAVDIWGDWEALTEDPEQPYIYAIYNRVLETTGVRQYIEDIHEKSDLGAAKFLDGTLDFVYIDADHSYNNTKNDILAWLPKVKKGGILAGHDYYQESKSTGVKAAVDELHETKLLPNLEFFSGNVWSVQL